MGLTPLAQDKNGIWLMQHPRPTEGFGFGTFDPSSSLVGEVKTKNIVKYSFDGSSLAYDSVSEPNVCDGFSSQSPTQFTITNPFSNQEIGRISQSGKHIKIKEFSQDGKNLLILVKELPENTTYDEKFCNEYWDEENGWELVSTDLKDTSPKIVKNSGEAYDIWYPNQQNPFVNIIDKKCELNLLDEEVKSFDCSKEVSVGILRSVQMN